MFAKHRMRNRLNKYPKRALTRNRFVCVFDTFSSHHSQTAAFKEAVRISEKDGGVLALLEDIKNLAANDRATPRRRHPRAGPADPARERLPLAS